MTIWRDWTGTNSVTGKPRPAATLIRAQPAPSRGAG